MSLEIENRQIRKVIFKKLVDDRVYDVADYFREKGRWEEKIIDRDRYDALKAGENFDMKTQKYSHIPEIQLYNEIKQFYRMFQTEETEDRLDKLEEVARLIEDRIEDDIGMDVLGSTNMGLCQTGSDIDFVLYIRCDPEGTADLNECEQYRKAQAILEEILRPDYAFQIMDCIDLGVVEKSIREKNYECDMTQRFVAYRAICRPINYRVIAPVEDLLNSGHGIPLRTGGQHPFLFQDFHQHVPAHPLFREVRKPDQGHRHQAPRFHPPEDQVLSPAG